MNEVFYEFKETKADNDLLSHMNIEIILHFLSKLEGSFCLFETKLSFLKSINSDIGQEVIKKLNEIFLSSDTKISLIKGKIREIFLSYSS